MKRRNVILRINTMLSDAEKACDHPNVKAEDWKYHQGQRDALRSVLALIDPYKILTPAEGRAIVDLVTAKIDQITGKVL